MHGLKMKGNDNPIKGVEEDLLSRSELARSFARQVASLDPSEGTVVGVLGTWGSGKTSFVNLARHHWEAEGIPIFDFNPWMFSGAEQLVGIFFVELAAELKLRPGFSGIGVLLQDYGESLSGLGRIPLLGPWIEGGRLVVKLLGKLLTRRKQGTSGSRAKLSEALAALDKPIVVVLDDIDRLTATEIRDVFRLIRLTASFPNLIYVVVFDRTQVEKALCEQGVPGRDYLEKILQVAVNLPAIPEHVLNRQIFTSINAVMSEIESPGEFDNQVWPDLFMEIIRPLVHNMRDVRRYENAIHATIESLGGQISLGDVLALEAIRIFMPDVFDRLHAAVESLTSTSEFGRGGGSDSPRLKSAIDILVETAGEQDEVVLSMIRRLFPAGQKHIGGMVYGADFKRNWLRNRRVAHEEILRLYLERVTGEKLEAFLSAGQALTVMLQRDEFDRFLRSLNPELLEDVISSLETYDDQLTPDHVVPGIVTLLNILPDIPERPRGMFDFDSRLAVGRVVNRLLKSLGDPAKVEVAVSQILCDLASLSSKLELITDVGYRDQDGNSFVSESVAAEFGVAWRLQVRSSSVADLAREWDLVRVLLVAKRGAATDEPSLLVPDDPTITLAILRSARSDAKSQAMDSRAVHKSPRLAWDNLIEIFGDQIELERRVCILKTLQPVGESALFELVDKYLGGWRPSEFGDD